MQLDWWELFETYSTLSRPPILWDSQHPKFKITELKYDFWMDVSNEINLDTN